MPGAGRLEARLEVGGERLEVDASGRPPERLEARRAPFRPFLPFHYGGIRWKSFASFILSTFPPNG